MLLQPILYKTGPKLFKYPYFSPKRMSANNNGDIGAVDWKSLQLHKCTEPLYCPVPSFKNRASQRLRCPPYGCEQPQYEMS